MQGDSEHASDAPAAPTSAAGNGFPQLLLRMADILNAVCCVECLHPWRKAAAHACA